MPAAASPFTTPTTPRRSWSAGSTGPGASTTVVDGYSNIRIEVPAAKLATSSYGASISRYELEAGDKKITVSPPAAGQPLVGTLTGVTGSLVKVTAYDSRGNSVSQSASAGHVAYQKPTFQSCRSSGRIWMDTKATLNCGVKWYSSAIGQTTNTLSVRYSYKKTSATSWSSPQTIAMNYTTNWASYNGLLNGDLGAGGFDADNSYDIKLECQDRLAGWVTIQLTLDRGIPTVHMTKNGLAIGKLHSSGALDVNGDIYCGNLYVKKDATYRSLLNAMYPVGSIYLSVSSVNPALWFGGTWEAWGRRAGTRGLQWFGRRFQRCGENRRRKAPYAEHWGNAWTWPHVQRMAVRYLHRRKYRHFEYRRRHEWKYQPSKWRFQFGTLWRLHRRRAGAQ